MSVDPARYNFKIYPGATFHEPVTYLTGDVGSSPKDLTGASAHMIVKDLGGNLLMTLDAGSNGGLTLGGGAGTITIIISSTTTQSLTWDTAMYELFVTDGITGETDLILVGGIMVQTF